MATKSGFAALQLGQVISIVTGHDASGTAVAARVALAAGNSLALQLMTARSAPVSLSAGDEVYVVEPSGRANRARVMRLPSGAAQTLVVESVLPSGELGRHERGKQRVGASSILAHVSMLHIGGARRFRVEVVDLSGGGARILSARPIASGDNIRVHLAMDARSKPWNAHAHVVWARPAEGRCLAGLRFLDLKEPEREEVRRLVFQARWKRDPRTARA
jgi:c-di-GMP-binding flagellar brake protein YcgR